MAVKCPFPKETMAVVFLTEICKTTDNDALGIQVFGALTPQERLQVFKACEWLIENPGWDKASYQGSIHV